MLGGRSMKPFSASNMHKGIHDPGHAVSFRTSRILSVPRLRITVRHDTRPVRMMSDSWISSHRHSFKVNVNWSGPRNLLSVVKNPQAHPGCFCLPSRTGGRPT